MPIRRTGIDPLAYMGVEPSTPAQFVRDNRNPTTSDYDGFIIGTVWIVKGTNAVWMLVDKADFIATWIQFTNNIAGVNTLTGNIGGAVPALAGNINVVGATPYSVSGNPGLNTLTIDDDGTIATIYDTDSGVAVPSANILNVIGGTGVTVTGSGNTLTINASSSNLEIQTDVGGPVSPDMSILQVLGGDNITTTGIGPNIIEAAVSGTTNHAVQVGNASGSLTSVGPLTTGQLLIGVTGSDPNPARLTAGSNIVIDDSSIPGQITISSTGGGGGGGNGCAIVAGQPNTIINENGSITWFSASSKLGASQAANQSVATESGFFRDMFVEISSNSSTVDTTVTLNINSVNSALVITIPAGMTGTFSDTTHMVSVNQGDLFQFEASAAVTGDTSGTLTVSFMCNGSGSGGIIITEFTSSDTWNKNPFSKWINVQITGTGCGGGSGRQGASGASCGGGGGPTFGGVNFAGPASRFPSSVAITIGAGGIGAAGVATPNTNGNDGTTGGGSSFADVNNGTLTLFPNGGRGGQAATTPQASGGPTVTGGLGWYSVPGRQGPGHSSPTTNVADTPSLDYFQGLGGAAGGCGSPAYSISTLQAGAGQSWYDSDVNIIYAGGAGGIESGTIDGGNGLDESTFSVTWNNMCGTGGGGGGGQSLGPVAGNGGDGGYPGGAGGGGGGSLNGTTSGSGGDGQAGIIYVYEYL